MMKPREATSASAQAWKTEGLAAMERPGVVVRLFMAIVALAERLNLACARLGNPVRVRHRRVSLGGRDRTRMARCCARNWTA